MGTIDLKKVLGGFADVVGEDVDAETRKQLEMVVEQFESLGIDEKIPFEIWIDEEGLPRRQRISMDFGDLVPGDEAASMKMTVDFSDFGKPVEIEIPALTGDGHDRCPGRRPRALRRLRLAAPGDLRSPCDR